MNTLCLASYAKINLGLRVLGRRSDGYHEIRSILQTIDLADEMRVEEDSSLSLRVEGKYPVAADDSNLVMRAARALERRYPGRGARITLRKWIPAGSGLGGGSSNAAATLMALDRLWGLQADPGLLYSLASGLGADVPFFLYGGTCLAVGRGDEVLPLPDQPEWGVVVAWPGVALATREVYGSLPLALTRPRILSNMKDFPPGNKDSAVRAGGRSAGCGSAGAAPEVVNDLEEAAFEKVPGLRRLKERLLDAGAVAAAMSGSGSAVFGLYPSSRGTDKTAASLASGRTAAFACRTLSREAYRLSLFRRSWT